MDPRIGDFTVQSGACAFAWQRLAAVSVSQLVSWFYPWNVYVALVLVCIVAAVATYRRRIQRVRASLGLIVEERNRIARECHDTLMAGFAAVSWQMEATTKRLKEGGDTSAAIESCELARSMVLHCQAEARRIIWDLRDSDEITGVLSHALSRAIQAHYRQHSIAVSLSVQGEEFELPPNSVHHLVCIGQEAISNALRHAAPRQIRVQLQFTEGGLRMEVRDDGCGFHSSPLAARQGHFGIAVMEERARKLGAEFTLRSTIAEGTVIAVRVPLTPENAMAEHLRPFGNDLVRWIGI